MKGLSVSSFKKFGVFLATSYGVIYTNILSSAIAAGVTAELPDSAVGGDLLGFVKDTLNLVIGLSALVAVGVLVYSGFLYITASGDEGKIEKATRGIAYAIIGLVLAFISVLIVNFVLQKVLKK